MNLSITNISESIKNPNGLFKTLSGIYAICDPIGEPLMVTHGHSVEFQVTYNKKKYSLRCLFGKECDSYRLREVSMITRLSDSGYLSPYIFMEKELTVFDNSDTAHEIDIILSRKPEGVSLKEVIGNIHTRSHEYIVNLIKNISSMAMWMKDHNFTHGLITSGNIIVNESAQPVMINYGCRLYSDLSNDLETLGKYAALLYVAGCAPDSVRKLTTDHQLTNENIDLLLGLLGEEGGHDQLQNLLQAIKSQSTPEEICEKIRSLASIEPKPCDKISEALEKMDAALPEVRKQSYVQEKLANYKFVSEIRDMMIRVWDGTHWYFLDKNGEVVISGEFISADDFSEGRAVVETSEGFGLLDSNGNFVIPPVYDDIEWDSNDNISIVTKDGLSGIISRSGDKITELIFDIILKPSEGLIAAKKNGLFGYIRKSGSTAIGFMFEDAFGFEGGVARVKVRGRDALIDKDGNQIDTL